MSTETLNASILEVIADTSLFPRDLGYRFTPIDRSPDALHINPRDPIYDGVVRDIVHPVDGVVVAKKTPLETEQVTYCCGVSFEAWYYAMQRYHDQHPPSELADDSSNSNPLSSLTSTQLLDMVNTWFCPVMGHNGMVSALLSIPASGAPGSSSTPTEDYVLGEEIPSLQEALPGDLIQYWRSVDLNKPSGHSAVFLRYDASTSSLYYWSSQRKTNGIGENVEVIDESTWKIYIIRPYTSFFRRASSN